MTLPVADSTPPAIADYGLLRLIGRGSYGDVWLARGVTGLYRAVKVVWRARFADAQPYEREFNGLKEFARVSLEESRQLALLHVGRGDDFFYYVMELADDAATGREIEPDRYVPHTLRETMARRGRLPAHEVVALAADLARALAGLHTRGLVHRDIKPSNVIFVGGVPKLADIGLVATASAELTFVGTEGYVPPEGPGAPSADVFSLGKLLYELATGLDRRDYPRLPADLHTLPDRKELLELNALVIRACDPLAARRYRDAAMLLDDVLLLQAGKSVRRLRAAERHLGRALRVAAALAVIAAVAGTGGWFEHRRAAEETAGRRQAESERDALARRSIYAATLAQAHRALERNDYGRARSLLQSIAPPTAGMADLRGFEWRALRAQAEGDPCDVLQAKGQVIDRLALSPDEQLLALHDESKTVVLFDTTTGREVRRIEGVQRLAGFSADGTWLVGTSTMPLAAPQRWRVTTGQSDRGVGKAPGVRPLAPLGNDRLVAVIDARAAPAGTSQNAAPLVLVVWDFTADRAVVRQPLDEDRPGLPWEYFRSAANPAGDELVLASIKGPTVNTRFRLTHLRIGTESSNFRHTELETFLPSALVHLPPPEDRDQWSAIEGVSGRRLVLDPGEGVWRVLPEKFPEGASAVVPASGSPSGSLLIAAHARVTMTVPGAPANLPARRFLGHSSVITALVAPRHDPRFFTASQTGELRRWATATSAPVIPQSEVWNSRALPTNLVYSRDSRLIFAPADSTRCLVLDRATLETRADIAGLHRPLHATATALFGLPADNLAIAAWDLATHRPGEKIAVGDSPIIHAVFSTDARHVCLTRANGELWTVDRRNPAAPVITKTVGRFESIRLRALAEDGGQVWTTSRNNELCGRTLPEGEPRWRTPLPARATDAVRLGAESALAVSLENGEIRIYALNDGRLLRTLPSGSSAPQGISVTPDGSRLLVAALEGDTHVLDAESGTFLATISRGNHAELHVIATAPDGASVATLTKNGILSVIHAPESVR